MSSYGEIKWATLISSEYPFRSLFQKAEYAWVEFRWGQGMVTLPEVSVYSPILVKKSFLVPKGTYPNVFLILRAYGPRGNSITSRFQMKWPAARFPLNKETDRLTYYPDSNVFVRIPIVTSNGKQPPKWAKFGKSDPTRLQGFSLEAAASNLRLSRRKMNPFAGESVEKDFTGTKYEPIMTGSYQSDGPPSSSETTSNYEVLWRTKVGQDTPNFAQLKKESQLPVNPYLIQIRRTQPGRGLQHVINSNNFVLIWTGPVIGAMVSLPAAAIGAFSAECLYRAQANLRRNADINISNIAVTLLQWKQLDRLLSGNVSKIVRSVNAVRKGRFRDADRILFGGRDPIFRKGKGPSRTKSLASNWLEYQYGWKPLLSDIKGTLEAHARFIAENREVVTVRGSATTERQTESAIMGPLMTSFSGISPFQVGKIESRYIDRLRYGLRFKLDDPTVAFMSQTGFLNPINVAWELIPFSFVLDWFIPIGPYLESFSTFKGFKFIDGYQTYTGRVNQLVAINDKRHTGSGTQAIDITSRGVGYRESVYHNRVKLTAFPTYAVPTFRNPVTMTRTLNALALLRVAFR